MQLCRFLWQPGSCKVLWQGSYVPTLRRGAILETSDSRVPYSCVDLEIEMNTNCFKIASLHLKILLKSETFPTKSTSQHYKSAMQKGCRVQVEVEHLSTGPRWLKPAPW